MNVFFAENERFKQLIDERKQHGDEERLKIQVIEIILLVATHSFLMKYLQNRF